MVPIVNETKKTYVVPYHFLVVWIVGLLNERKLLWAKGSECTDQLSKLDTEHKNRNGCYGRVCYVVAR